MSENKKVGRPKGTTNTGFTTNRFSLTIKEAEQLENKYQAFKEAHSLDKFSKSEFYRMLILKSLKSIK